MATAFASQPRPELIYSAGGPGIPAVEFLPLAEAAPAIPGEAVAVPATGSARRPPQILLGTLSDLGFRVTKAIEVQVRTDAATVVASWPAIAEFGTGSSTSEACEDLGRTVAELYRSLDADRDRLGPDLARVRALLQGYLVPRR